MVPAAELTATDVPLLRSTATAPPALAGPQSLLCAGYNNRRVEPYSTPLEAPEILVSHPLKLP